MCIRDRMGGAQTPGGGPLDATGPQTAGGSLDATPRAPMPASGSQPARSAAVGGSRTPTPPGVPRTKPPSAPPGKRRASQEMPAAAPGDSSSGVASVHDIQGKIHIDIATASGAVQANPHDTTRASESMQFVMPRAEPAAPQESLDGSSMISRAVASATALVTAGPRTRSGGTPPRPLSELATDELLRPDEGDDAFEIAANGALIVRI